MKSYIPPDFITLANIASGACRLLVLPMKPQPAPRPKGSLLEGLGGLWIWTRDRSYRVCDPQSKILDEAFPLGPTGSVVMIKEPLTKNRLGVWCRADGNPITLLEGDPRIPEMVAWAHHYELSACSAPSMPSWAARYHLKIGRVYAKRMVELTNAEAQAAGHKFGLQAMLTWLRSTIGETEFKGSLWLWLAEVEPHTEAPR
jgi:hypothetical protein